MQDDRTSASSGLKGSYPSSFERPTIHPSILIKPNPRMKASILFHQERTKAGARSDDSFRKILKGIGSTKLELTFPAIKPEKGICMYLQSKQNAKATLGLPKFKEEMTITPGMATVQSRREMTESIQRLKQKRLATTQRREEMADQWKDLRKKEADLHKAFKKYNTFVRENEEKRVRSVRRIQYFTHMTEFRLKETEDLQKKYDYAQHIKGLMEKKIKEYSMYENYLNNTATTSKGEFRAAVDFITRYEALLESKHLIKQKHEAANKALEDAVATMRRNQEEAMLKLVGLRNVAATLTERCEQARFKSLKWETIVGLIDDYSMCTREQIIRTKDACWNVYTGFAKRKDVPVTLTEDNLKAQLIFIKKSLEDAAFIKKVLASNRNSSAIL